MPASVSDLERINGIVDLCIDRGLFEYVASNGDDSILKLSPDAANFISELTQKPANTPFRKLGCPVQSVYLPAKLIEPSGEKWNRGRISLSGSGETGLKPTIAKSWSDLFWGKVLRAELQHHNKRPWVDRYDDLVLFLEACVPRKEDRASVSKDDDWDITLFCFLMELSAVAQGQASYGYAERGRSLIQKLYKIESPKIKDRPGHSRHRYDRWIWFNMGLAYQHVGQHQEAVREFNQVISRFFNSKEPNAEDNNDFLEFLLNVYPSILQRAAINLKLQMAYHALQTLADSKVINFLEVLRGNKAALFTRAVEELTIRSDLLKVEALLQSERPEEAQRVLTDLYPRIFPRKSLNIEFGSLPRYAQEPRAIQIQMVEQVVCWFLEKTDGPKGLRDSVNRLWQRRKQIRPDKWQGEINEWVLELVNIVEKCAKISSLVQNEYWKWVKENQLDRQIYFCRWAKVLRLTAEILNTMKEIEKELLKTGGQIPDVLKESANRLIEYSVELYCSRAKDRPRKMIHLAKLRSDDLPDFVAGLSEYYKGLSDILLLKDKNIPNEVREVHEEHADTSRKAFNGACKSFTSIKDPNFRTACRQNDLLFLLRSDHLDLLAELDEYEKEYGENQKVSSLKRCNERLIWIDHQVCNNSSKKPCCFPRIGSKNGFCGLLECAGKYQPPTGEIEQSLNVRPGREDYESIILEAEERLTKHLRNFSQPEPKRHALRFLGLQRWNSLTPAQGRSVGGGYFIYRTNKHFVVDLGIAIDPGFDFVRNLFRMGFTLRDIDIVLISHAHADHLWDFESLIQLLKELSDKTGITHRLNVVLTLGIYKRFQHVIENQELRRFLDPLVIDSRKELEPDFFETLGPKVDGEVKGIEDHINKKCFRFFRRTENQNEKALNNGMELMRWLPVLPGIEMMNGSKEKPEIEIWPTRAYHDDYSQRSDSFGFLIRFIEIDPPIKRDRPLCIGYTGDTKWVHDDLYNEGCPGRSKLDAQPCKDKCKEVGDHWKGVVAQYHECDLLLMHIGSLIQHKKDKWFKDYRSFKECESMMRKENHPYLMGIIRFLYELRELQKSTLGQDERKLILIGEFGEELRGGIRTDIVRRLKEGIDLDWPIVPVDVGLDILLDDYDFIPDKGNEEKGNGFKFLCVQCDHYHELGKIDYIRFGQDEAIFSVCRTCKIAVPEDVRNTKLQHLYEIGREPRTVEGM